MTTLETMERASRLQARLVAKYRVLSAEFRVARERGDESARERLAALLDRTYARACRVYEIHKALFEASQVRALH